MTARKHSWRQNLQDLVALTETMISSSDPEELNRQLTERIARLTGGRSCLIALYDRTRRRFIVQKPYFGIREKQDIQLEYEITRAHHKLWNFRKQGVLLSNNPESDPGIFAGLIKNFAIRSIILAPMVVQQRLLGILCIMNKRGGFTEFDSYLASIVAYQTGIILTNARLMNEERRHNEQMLLLSELISELASILDTDQVVKTTVERIKQRFHYYFVTFAWADHEAGVLKDWYFLPKFEKEVPSIPFEQGLTGRAVRTGKKVLVNDTASDPDYVRVFEEVQSEIVMPIRIGETIVGILDLQSDRLNAFDDSDLLILETLANAVSTALQKADSYQRLERINAKLTQTAQQKDEIVQIVAHDFRSPLTVIRGYMDFLLKKGDWKDDKQKEIMETVSLQAQRLQKLAEATLKASRLDSGEISFTFEKVDFHAFLKHFIVPWSEKHQFLLKPDADLPLIHADTGRMQEVMENLLSNAIKYSPEGGTIEVLARCVEAKDLPAEFIEERPVRYLLVSVSDEGIGIPQEKQKILFTRFARVHDNKKIEGIGLGLYIAKKMIEAHGGRIWLEAQQKGAKFCFAIPCSDEDVAKENILIIDDDLHTLRLLHRALSETGFDILTATDGKEALEKLYRFHPQIVILDVFMPVLSGIEFIERLKTNEQTKGIHVIVFTAKSDFSLPSEYSSIPVVSKAAGIGALRAQIDQFLRRLKQATRNAD